MLPWPPPAAHHLPPLSLRPPRPHQPAGGSSPPIPPSNRVSCLQRTYPRCSCGSPSVASHVLLPSSAVIPRGPALAVLAEAQRPPCPLPRLSRRAGIWAVTFRFSAGPGPCCNPSWLTRRTRDRRSASAYPTSPVGTRTQLRGSGRCRAAPAGSGSSPTRT